MHRAQVIVLSNLDRGDNFNFMVDELLPTQPTPAIALDGDL